MECQRSACRREYQALAANVSDEDELVHCGETDCHSIYWSDKNGARCDQCFTDACEACADDETKGCMLDDLWYCVDCRDQLVREKQLVRCMNPHHACSSYAYAKDFACTRCGVAVCDDCHSEVFLGKLGSGKILCKTCARLNKK